jgi:hypothetical protein
MSIDFANVAIGLGYPGRSVNPAMDRCAGIQTFDGNGVGTRAIAFPGLAFKENLPHIRGQTRLDRAPRHKGVVRRRP